MAVGGVVDEADRYISPTILKDVSVNDAVMQEEVSNSAVTSIGYHGRATGEVIFQS